MIGTVICRNCDTAIEISEGDVARFRTNPVFACSVCGEDLSQRMGELIGRSPDGPERQTENDPNEFTVPDDQEVFDGLPMGESFDDAAQRLKAGKGGEPRHDAGKAAAPGKPPAVAKGAGPKPEDPATLALRIAEQAREQAQAFAATFASGSAPKVARSTPAGGVKSPADAPLAAASTEVGVVPEEPENEPTVRRGQTDGTEGELSVAEPTLPSDGGDEPEAPGTDSVPSDATPTLPPDVRNEMADEESTAEAPGGPDEGILPDSPVSEATPPVSRKRTGSVPDVPAQEATIRKPGPPPPLRATSPLIASGPSEVGALGFRVVQSRTVVRPDGSSHAAAALPATGETRVGDDTRISSAPVETDLVSRPSPAASGRRSPMARWALFGVGGLIVFLASAFTITRIVGIGMRPQATPYTNLTPPGDIPDTEPDALAASATSTPEPEPTASPVETVVTNPVRTDPPSTPLTPSPRLSVPATSPKPTPTVVAKVNPPQPVDNTKQVLQETRRRDTEEGLPRALIYLNGEIREQSRNEKLLYGAFAWASLHPDDRAKAYATVWAKRYRDRFPTAPAVQRERVNKWIADNSPDPE